MREGWRVAVIGAAGLVGRELTAVLHEREFPCREVRLYDAEGNLEDASSDDRVLSIDHVDLLGIDLAFLCGPETIALEWGPKVAAEGGRILDLTQCLSNRTEVPLVVPELNAEEVSGSDVRAVANPIGGAIALAVVLGPIAESVGLRRVVAVGFEPASGVGRSGVEELARQSRDLLSGRSTEAVVFPRRSAFNLIPQVDKFMADGRSLLESQIEAQTLRLLDIADLAVSVTCVRVPTFFGQAYCVNVETGVPIAPESLGEVLRSAPGVLLANDAGRNYSTLTEVLDVDATCVGRIRVDPTVPCGLNLWVAIDGLRKGGAVNAVQIAELWYQSTS